MNNLHLVELSQYEKPVITEEKNRDWVGIGEENNYYQDLIDAYMNSTTNRSVITGIGQQIYGRGLDATDSNKKPEQFAQMKGLLKPDCLRKVCLDLKMLGEASLQVSYKGKKVASVLHFPRETLRAEKMNDKGQIENYYYAPDWTKVTQATELTKMPVFGSKNSGNEIYVIKKYIPSYYYYSPADYSTSYPVLESEIADYLINETMSSFNSRTIVNFNSGVPSEEKMQEIKSQVLNRLTGANGEKVIVAFNHNAEQKTTIDSLPVQQAPELYEYLSEECKRMILLTHRVTSPLLIGLRDMGGSGLGSNEDEIRTAQRLFSNTTIKPYQDLICDALDEILEKNGISLNLYFKTSDPLEFISVEDIDNDEVKEEETGVKEELELEMLASKPHTPEITEEVLNSVADDLIDLGENEEDLLKKYDVIDEMEVDYKQEERLDKMIGLASTGRAYPNAKSSQDGTSKQKSQEGVQFLVRYTYSPKKVSDNSREFCKKMVKADKVYRKEDILRMSDKVVNAGFGKGGSDTYSIWLYKGGARCSHKWFRKTYQIKDGKKTEITTGQAKSKGFKPQVNEQKVSVAPKDMPNQGFVNKPKKKK